MAGKITGIGAATAAQKESLKDADALLDAVRRGDMGARDELIERIHPELRRLARVLMTKERRLHTLGTSGLVSLLWLRLLSTPRTTKGGKRRETLADVKTRQHLLALAVRNMREILVDYARMRNAQKRPRPNDQVEMDLAVMLGAEMAALSPGTLDIHEALQKLEPVMPDSAYAIELKYFAGFTNEEGAAAIGIPLIQFRRRCDDGLEFMRGVLLTRRRAAGAR